MKKILLVLVSVSFLYSCNKLNVQRKNTITDKIEAEKVVNLYFENLKFDKRDDNLKLFSNSFFDKISKEDFKKDSGIVDIKLGKVKDRKLLKWETNIVDGTNPKSEYLLIYDVQRENYNSKETFYLLKEATDSIKINSYQVESEGLLKE